MLVWVLDSNAWRSAGARQDGMAETGLECGISLDTLGERDAWPERWRSLDSLACGS